MPVAAPVSIMMYHGTVRRLPLGEQLGVAAALGAETLTIGPREYRAWTESGLGASEIRARAADAGVRIDHIDPFIRWVPDAAFAGGSVPFETHPDTDELFRMADALDARSVSVVGMFPHGALGVEEMTDRFGAFLRRATERGLRCDLEFVPIWGLPDLATARAILRGAGGGGLMFDIWHYSRGRPDDALLGCIPGSAVHCVQLNDGTATVPAGRDPLEDTRNHRRLPGQGEFRVREIVSILRGIGGLNNVGLEVFSQEFDRLGVEEIVERCRSGLAFALDDAPAPEFVPIEGRETC